MTLVRHIAAAAAGTLALGLLTSPPATADRGPERFPSIVDLPNGFLPEGIAIGRGPTAWFGSRADGDIYQADLRTGEGRTISQGPGTASVGLKYADGRLYVAGGPTGTLRVVDVDSGEIERTYALSTGESFVNDVLIHRGSVWVTDSRQAALYRLPLTRSGDLPPASAVERLPLTGDWVQAPAGVNAANGIAPTPDGKTLIVVHSAEAALHRVDPRSGETTRLDVGEPMTNGDGLLLEGRTLYVVQNRLNRVAVVRLDPRGTSGRVVDALTSPAFEVPTTVARFGDGLYLPNAQFGLPDQTDFEAVRISRR